MSFITQLFGKKGSQRQSFDADQFMRAFEQFVNATTWNESQRIVERTSLLLDPRADDLLQQLAAAQSDPQNQQVVEEHRDLLRCCREADIPRAFAERIGGATSGGINVPLEFDHDWDQASDAEERYLHTGRRSELDAAAAAWERILHHPTFSASADRFQLAAINWTLDNRRSGR